jgi:uncharacterized membrane protein YdcZ (DUF606 family)
MSGVSAKEACKGCVLILFALIPGYLSMEGMVTGQTRVFSRFADSPQAGAAGLVTAVAYGLFAAALILAALTFFTAVAKRRSRFSRWGVRTMLVGLAFLVLGVIILRFAAWH